MLSPSLRANRPDPGLFGANSGSIKSHDSDITMGRWLMFSPASPRSLSLNLTVAHGRCSICPWEPQISILKHLTKTSHAEWACFFWQVYSEWYCMVPESVHCQRLSSAHVLLPSHGLHAADKSSHSNKPFTVVIFVCLDRPVMCRVRCAIWTQEHTGGGESTTCASQYLYRVTYRVIVLGDQAHLLFEDFNLANLGVDALLKCALVCTVSIISNFRVIHPLWLSILCKMQRQISKVGEMTSSFVTL